MAKRCPQEMRSLAQRFREMAIDGDDERIKAALLQLADEFEEEADEDRFIKTENRSLASEL